MIPYFRFCCSAMVTATLFRFCCILDRNNMLFGTVYASGRKLKGVFGCLSPEGDHAMKVITHILLTFIVSM